MSGLWIFLIILHVWQAFEEASDSKCARVLNMEWLCIQGLHKVLTMSEYGSICLNNAWMSQYTSMSLDMHKHDWILLNVPEYAWKFLNKLYWLCKGSQYASSSEMFDKVFNVPQALNMTWFWICHNIYCYNKIIIIIIIIIIITNIIILEFLLY